MAAASDELHSPLNASDLHNLAADVEKRLEGRDRVTTLEIYRSLIETMNKRGFVELARAYVKK